MTVVVPWRSSSGLRLVWLLFAMQETALRVNGLRWRRLMPLRDCLVLLQWWRLLYFSWRPFHSVLLNYLPFLSRILSENAFATSVAVVFSLYSGWLVILLFSSQRWANCDQAAIFLRFILTGSSWHATYCGIYESFFFICEIKAPQRPYPTASYHDRQLGVHKYKPRWFRSPSPFCVIT